MQINFIFKTKVKKVYDRARLRKDYEKNSKKIILQLPRTCVQFQLCTMLLKCCANHVCTTALSHRYFRGYSALVQSPDRGEVRWGGGEVRWVLALKMAQCPMVKETSVVKGLRAAWLRISRSFIAHVTCLQIFTSKTCRFHHNVLTFNINR